MKTTEGQFVMVPYEIYNLVEEGILTMREKYLYELLKQYHPCRPGMQHLASRLGVDRRTVIRCIGTLRFHGIITRIKGNSNGVANLYTILPPDKWKIQRIEND